MTKMAKSLFILFYFLYCTGRSVRKYYITSVTWSHHMISHMIGMGK